MNAVAVAGERIRLPGGLRSSDTFELEGHLELQQLMLDRGHISVLGALRSWSGTIGDAEDWNAVAPWPRASYCWLAFAACTVTAVFATLRARTRLRAWRMETA
jgi:hypothetical protein